VLGSTVVLVGSVVLTLCVGPFRGSPLDVDLWYQDHVPRRHVVALDAAVALVPDGVPVAATNKAGSHLSGRRYFYSVPFVEQAHWIVLDTRDPWIASQRGSLTLGEHPREFRAFMRRIERSPLWTKVFEQDGVLVFRRSKR
jgi:hypothetical protein